MNFYFKFEIFRRVFTYYCDFSYSKLIKNNDTKIQTEAHKENILPIAIPNEIQYDSTVIVIMIKEKKVFLMQRLDACATYKGYYAVAGGKLERNEDPLTGAIRELKEESGIDLTGQESRFEFVEASKKEPTAKIEYVYKVWLRPGEIPENKEPHKHSNWVAYPIKDAMQLKLIPKLVGYFEEMLQKEG